MVKRAARQNGAKPKAGKNLADKITVTIDGRKFVEVGEKRTFEQDIHMMDLLERMGMNDFDPQSFAGPSKMQREAFKLISKAYQSGVLFEMLGTALVEENKEEDWTPEVAEEVGELFRTTSDTKARQELERSVVVLLFNFFASALASQETFPNFSVEALDVGGKKASAPEAPSNSESGSPLSERLQKATRIAESRLSGGQ